MNQTLLIGLGGVLVFAATLALVRNDSASVPLPVNDGWLIIDCERSY